MRQGIRDHAVKLPRVHRIKAGGRVYRYHRVTRALLPDLPESHPDFVAAWAAEDAKAAPTSTRARGSVGHAVEETAKARKFMALSPGYRAMMRREFDAIVADYGAIPIKEPKPRHIRSDLGKLDPVKANKRLRAWRLIYAHAIAQEWVDADPSLGIKKAAEGTTSRAAWTEADVAKFRARWPIGTAARGCFELLWWTGCRDSDAVAMAWSHIGDDGVLAFRQRKTGGMAYVPWTAPLPVWAAGWQAGRAQAIEAVRAVAPGGFTMLETAGARARSAKGLSNLISAAAREAKIEGKTAHGLRVARLTALAEAGAPTQAIMSWGGHKTLQEAEHYTATAGRKHHVVGVEQEQNDVKGHVKRNVKD